MARFSTVVALLVCGCSVRSFNRATLGAATATLACDVGQTMSGLDQGIPETNPMLGENPSTSRLVTYNSAAVGAMVGSYELVGRTLGERWQWTVPFAVLWLELALVSRNAIVLDHGAICGLD
jgi:hypothetical protein